MKHQNLSCLVELEVYHKLHTINKLQPPKLEIQLKLLMLLTIIRER